MSNTENTLLGDFVLNKLFCNNQKNFEQQLFFLRHNMNK